MDAFEFVRHLPSWFWAGPAIGLMAICVIAAMRIRHIRWGRNTIDFDRDTRSALQSTVSD
jgi:hypothetical protein